MTIPHALLLPYPAQGHVIPLLELAYCLADRGFKITFVNTDFIHHRVVAAMSKKKNCDNNDWIRLVSIPDGLSPDDDDRQDLGSLTVSIQNHMPKHLEGLIQNTNNSGGDKITCLIADQNMAWALNVAEKTGLRSAAFYPASAGLLVSMLSIPKLIGDGVIDEDGATKITGMVRLSPDMPHFNTDHFAWNCMGDMKMKQPVFEYLQKNNESLKIAEFIVCNSFYEIEKPVFTYAPDILPIGPLLTGHRFGKPVGHFWPEDDTCTSWLDEQPDGSVVYVAFGSFTIFNPRQFEELALGLELTGRPFLWVVRPESTSTAEEDAYPNGFRERVAGRGKMVGWCPQQRVLGHPAIACFVSHCGWNSTMEGVTNGLPLLCWPYFADQFLNMSYICDVWRTGLEMVGDDSGVISKEQIKSKVETLLGDEEMKVRALVLKETANASISKGGLSFENFNNFVDSMKN